MESFSAMFDWENRFPGFPSFLFNQHSGKLENREEKIDIYLYIV